MSEHKPCPFCGGEGRIAMFDDRDGYTVECGECLTGSGVPSPTKADAWRRWDHRASDTQCATCVWFRISDAFDWCELVHQKRNPSDFCSKWKGME